MNTHQLVRTQQVAQALLKMAQKQAKETPKIPAWAVAIAVVKPKYSLKHG